MTDPPTLGMTADEIRALPVTVDLVTAARAFGIGKTNAYKLAHAGTFPVRVLRLGRRMVVTREALLEALNMPAAPPPPRPVSRLGDATLAPVRHPSTSAPRVWWDGRDLFVVFPDAPNWVCVVNPQHMARWPATVNTDGCTEYRAVPQ